MVTTLAEGQVCDFTPHSGQMSQDIVDTTLRRWSMSALGCYIVDAIVFEHRSPATLARDHGISRSWIYRLLQRFKEGGYASLPRSRRPRSCSHQTGADIVANVLKLRDELTSAGHDAGPQTILYHLARQSRGGPSAATIWRFLKRNGLITAQPHKRPRSHSSVSSPSCPTRPGS